MNFIPDTVLKLFFAVITIFLIMALLVRFQRALEIKYAGYVTLVAGLLLTGGALRSAISSEFPYDFDVSALWGRVAVVVFWIFIQIVFLCVGFITKVVFPCTFSFVSLIPLFPGHHSRFLHSLLNVGNFAWMPGPCVPIQHSYSSLVFASFRFEMKFIIQI